MFKKSQTGATKKAVSRLKIPTRVTSAQQTVSAMNHCCAGYGKQGIAEAVHQEISPEHCDTGVHSHKQRRPQEPLAGSHP